MSTNSNGRYEVYFSTRTARVRPNREGEMVLAFDLNRDEMGAAKAAGYRGNDVVAYENIVRRVIATGRAASQRLFGMLSPDKTEMLLTFVVGNGCNIERIISVEDAESLLSSMNTLRALRATITALEGPNGEQIEQELRTVLGLNETPLGSQKAEAKPLPKASTLTHKALAGLLDNAVGTGGSEKAEKPARKPSERISVDDVANKLGHSKEDVLKAMAGLKMTLIPERGETIPAHWLGRIEKALAAPPAETASTESTEAGTPADVANSSAEAPATETATGGITIADLAEKLGVAPTNIMGALAIEGIEVDEGAKLTADMVAKVEATLA